MYNEELKGEFIAQYSTKESRREAVRMLFDATQPYEEEWQADICTRRKEELQPVVNKIVGLRDYSKKLRLNILRDYAKWCIAKGVKGACSAALQISDVGVEVMREKMVANPNHLQRYLNTVCDEEKMETVDCIYRAYYWLAYMGFERKEDVFKLTSENMDFDDLVVRYNGREYPMYREAVPCLRRCTTLTQFQLANPKYIKTAYRQRCSGDLILRGVGEDEVQPNILMANMSHKCRVKKHRDKYDPNDKSLDLQLSFYRLWLSGIFYRMYEAERAGMPPDFTQTATEHMENIEYNLGKTRESLKAKRNRLAKEYLEDYNRWKEAYSI